MTPPGGPSPADLAARQLDAYNAHDIDAFAACYAADVEVFRLPSGEVVASGREDLRARWGDLFRKVPGRRARLLGRVASGAFVVDHEGVSDGPGTPERSALAIYEVEGGLIRRVWFPPPAEEPPR